jgi:hypothetical protein
MSVSFATLRCLLPVLLLPLLFGCGPGRNEFAPVCPNPVFLRELSDLTRYRPDSQGRDLTDLVLSARLSAVRGECAEGATSRSLDTTITVTVELVRGPAMRGRVDEVPVFVALNDGDDILNKQIYPVQFEFPSTMERIAITTPLIQLTVPVSPQKSGAAYAIILGFQLTPEEREVNRHRSGLR